MYTTLCMFIEQRTSMPFKLTCASEHGVNFIYSPNGTRIDDPVSLTYDSWQTTLDDFCMTYPDAPEGLAKSAHLAYYAARGIESVYPQGSNHTPGLMIYDGQYPGIAKNFFRADDWSIYMNARWFARRSRHDPDLERPFYTERNELLFFGTPGARAAIIAMEEAEHALDFAKGNLEGEKSTGMQARTDTLVEYDSRRPEFLALCQTLERMKAMPEIFSDHSIASIAHRIQAVEQSELNHFFIPTF